MSNDELIFSVEDLSVWQVYNWQWMVPLYIVCIILLMFPGTAKVWPLSSFSFLKDAGRKNGLLTLALVSVISVGHFLFTYLPLMQEKQNLSSGGFSVLEGSFDGRQPDRIIAGQRFPETTLMFDGVEYEMPGSLHGSVFLLPRVRAELEVGEKYNLYIADGIVLRIDSSLNE